MSRWKRGANPRGAGRHERRGESRRRAAAGGRRLRLRRAPGVRLHHRGRHQQRDLRRDLRVDATTFGDFGARRRVLVWMGPCCGPWRRASAARCCGARSERRRGGATYELLHRGAGASLQACDPCACTRACVRLPAGLSVTSGYMCDEGPGETVTPFRAAGRLGRGVCRARHGRRAAAFGSFEIAPVTERACEVVAAPGAARRRAAGEHGNRRRVRGRRLERCPQTGSSLHVAEEAHAGWLPGLCLSAVRGCNLLADAARRLGETAGSSGRQWRAREAAQGIHSSQHSAVRVDEEGSGIPVPVSGNRPDTMHDGSEALPFVQRSIRSLPY